jgi:hypothetical protein
VPLRSQKGPAAVVRCDLCGREAKPAKPYTLLSRVVPRPEKRISLEPTDSSSLSSETTFTTHDFAVCPLCHGRKTVYLVISLAMLAGWVWLALKSRGPLFPLIGLVVILAFVIGSGRFLPVQRLARRIRRERRRAVSAAHPGLRFYVETLTPEAQRMRQQFPAAKIMVKRCEACKREVPLSSKAGELCPHCGVRWGSETKQCDECRAQVPVSVRAGDPCPRCGARWGA